MFRTSALFDSRTHRKCRRERTAAETAHVTQEGGIGTAARLLLFTEGNDHGNLPSLTPFPSDRPIGAALGQTSAAALPRRARRCTDFQHSATDPGGSVVTPIRWFPSAGNPHECLLCGVGTSYFATENWGFIGAGEGRGLRGRLLLHINRQRWQRVVTVVLPPSHQCKTPKA